MLRRLGSTLLVLLVMALAACAPPSGTPGQGQPASADRPTASKRVVLAAQSDPPVLVGRLTSANEPGLGSIEDLYNPGLGGADKQGTFVPIIAEQAPTVANGLWKVLPDGRMETTWRLRAGVAWHDGPPFTADDVLFSYQIDADPDLPFSTPSAAFRQVDRVEATDDRTVVIHWKGPYIDADTAFQGRSLPRHLLERPYREDKSAFAQLPYWAQPPIGVGAFKVREWSRGSHLILDANDGYVHGRPKIDVLEVKLIPDQNTLLANILAGGIDLTLGKNITLEQAVELRERWASGRVETMPMSSLQVYPQTLNPNPPAIADARFRRALYHATDRQEITDSLMGGFSSVVHSYLSPAEPPEFQAMAPRVVKYEHDPRRAVQILEGMGFPRGSDGIFRDERGQRINVEIRTITTDINTKAMLSVGDYWQRAGVATEPFVIPRQLAQDMEYRATFPGYELVRNPAARGGLARHRIAQTPLPENGFRGNNRTRYMNPEFDSLLDRYFTTIPIGERAQIFGDIIHHMTDVALVMGLFYDVEPTAISKRLLNVSVGDHREAWTVHLWDVAG